MVGYVAFGDDDKPGDLTSRVSREEADPKSGFFNRMGRAISPKTTSSGRRKLASRSSTGDISPEVRPLGMYDQSPVKFTNQAQWNAGPEEKEQDEKRLRAQMRDYYAEKEDESMKKAKEMYDEEVKNAKEKEKTEKKRKSKCNSELRRCYMNCKAPGYRSKYDCDKCTAKIFDRVNAGQSACDDNTVSHYKADCDKHCREGGYTTQMKAKLGNKKAQEELKEMKGTYGDNLPQEEEHYRSNPGVSVGMTKSSAHNIRSRLGDRVGRDYLGNLSPRKLKKAEPSAPPSSPPLSSFAMGGARRRRRTKRRKPKKSKKSKRTRRTRRR
jgi:hypothetical protein